MTETQAKPTDTERFVARREAFLASENLTLEEYHALLDGAHTKLVEKTLPTPQEKRVLQAFFHKDPEDPSRDWSFGIVMLMSDYHNAIGECFDLLVDMGHAEHWENEDGITMGEFHQHLVDALEKLPTQE